MGTCCSQKIDLKTSASGPGVIVDTEDFSKIIWRIALCLVIAGQSMVFSLGINNTPPDYATPIYWLIHGSLLISALGVLFLLGGPLFLDFVNAIKHRKLSLEGLFVLSMLGALIGSIITTTTGQGSVYYEVVSIVLIIYTTGKLLGKRSRKKAINESNKIKQTFNETEIITPSGERKLIPIDSLNCCSIVIAGPGRPICVDGLIIEGEGYVNETAMTGELEPIVKSPGNLIFAGSYSIDGTFKIKPTAFKGDRKLDSLIKTVEEASLSPSNLQTQADAVMQWFLPFVLTVALGTFLFWLGHVDWIKALFNSMSVLLVACPCALGLATPLAIWSGLWKLSTLGIVSKSGDFLDTLAQSKNIIFDKTGTLSSETLAISNFINLSNLDNDLLQSLIVTAELSLDHPIAKSLTKLSNKYTQNCTLLTSKLIPGRGIISEIAHNNTTYLLHIGEKSLNEESSSSFPTPTQDHVKKRIFVSVNHQPAAIIELLEEYRDGLQDVFENLTNLGIEGLILTGDASFKPSSIQNINVQSGLSPNQKEEIVTKLEDSGKSVIFLGDGINDAAAMSKASASIAMNSGAALTQSTASAILMGESLQCLPQAIKLARKIRKSVKANMIFAAIYNTIGMTFAALGLLHPVVAALIMLISSSFVSIRAIKATKL